MMGLDFFKENPGLNEFAVDAVDNYPRMLVKTLESLIEFLQFFLWAMIPTN